MAVPHHPWVMGAATSLNPLRCAIATPKPSRLPSPPPPTARRLRRLVRLPYCTPQPALCTVHAGGSPPATLRRRTAALPHCPSARQLSRSPAHARATRQRRPRRPDATARDRPPRRLLLCLYVLVVSPTSSTPALRPPLRAPVRRRTDRAYTLSISRHTGSF